VAHQGDEGSSGTAGAQEVTGGDFLHPSPLWLGTS
jgi:hypothetical protein